MYPAYLLFSEAQTDILNRIAVESLLESDFEPTRSIVLAMGIDEERGGVYVSTFPIMC